MTDSLPGAEAAVERGRRHEDHGTAVESLAGHAAMRVVRERHQYRGRRFQQIRTEIAEVGGAELRRPQKVLCARAHDHGAHPRLVETVADPHAAHCLGWRFDRWTVV